MKLRFNVPNRNIKKYENSQFAILGFVKANAKLTKLTEIQKSQNLPRWDEIWAA